MSKKKAPASSTTMTLKDFHGGSIPSDLPLPSAPAATERVQNRLTSYGLKPDHRPRPGSSNAVKNFDDRFPFLSPNLPIGLNFDEDERSPLGGGIGSGSRRTTTSSLPTSRLAEAEDVEWVSRKLGGTGLSGGGKTGSGVCGNARAKSKKTTTITVPLPASSSGPSVVSKFARASAFDKVSSGAWQSKQQSRSGLVSVAGDPQCHDTSLARQADNKFIANNEILGGGRNFTISESEQITSPVLPEILKIKHLGCSNGVQPPLDDIKFGIPELRLSEPVQKAERPKLKLLPRSKPLENSVPPRHVNQGYQPPLNSQHLEDVTKIGITDPSGSDLAGSQSRNQEAECPKLNFRWQPHLLFQNAQHVEGDSERNTVSGVDSTRESVLKEHVVGDVSVNSHGGQTHNRSYSSISRAKQDVPRTDPKSAGSSHRRYNEKTVDIPIDHRMIRNNDNRWAELEKTDSQRANWRSERWRNNREVEKQRQQPLERPCSPDTWRKPIEPHPTTSSVGVSGLHSSKAVSAIELAQSFSRYLPDPKTDVPLTGRKGVPVPGQSEMPFSRLTNTTSRRQIDGY